MRGASPASGQRQTCERGHDEITMDFARFDPVEPRGMVVARVTCSPSFVRRVIDELERVWRDRVWGSSPPETRNP